MYENIVIIEVYDRPMPGPGADDAAWLEFTKSSQIIGNAVEYEIGSEKYSVTFKGPADHARARAYAEMLNSLRMVT